MDDYHFTDEIGDTLAIRSGKKSGSDGHAVVDADPFGGHPGILVPAHKLAEVAGALYEAAGQPVPDLPAICDEAEVHRLAAILHYAIQGTMGASSQDRMYARVLLAHGVRCPEPS